MLAATGEAAIIHPATACPRRCRPGPEVLRTPAGPPFFLVLRSRPPLDAPLLAPCCRLLPRGVPVRAAGNIRNIIFTDDLSPETTRRAPLPRTLEHRKGFRS